MKRLAVWGTGRRCAMWYWWLKEHYEISCFVNNENNEDCRFDEIDWISKHELERYKYDAVVIVSDRNVDEIIVEVLGIGVEPNEIFTLDDFVVNEGLVGVYENKEVERQLEIIREILSATEEQIQDYDWMYKKVSEYGIFCFQNNWYMMSGNIHWSYDGIQQISEEFTEYCMMLSGLTIKSAVEIGVYRGRSAYFVCAVLSRRNPSLKYLMVDVKDRLDHFEQFQEILPALEKHIPSMSFDFHGHRFDYVFIDADHSYDASIADYENVGAFSNVITAFHDIYAHEYDHENGGTVRMWQEVLDRTKDKEHKVFSRYPDKWMGIGCVLNGKQ